jgi:hypothetical protein
MRIQFERQGGYAGLRLAYGTELEALPAQAAAELRALIEAAGLLDTPCPFTSASSAGPPDVMSYRLTVHDGEHACDLTFNDVTAPAALRPLLARLVELAIASRRTKGS